MSLAAVSLLVGAWLVPVVAFAALPPHVAESTQTAGTCAICHRAHTANSDQAYRTPLSVELTGNALIIAPPSAFGATGFPAPNRGDIGLCYTCHGAPGLGSQYDVETSFTLVSTHDMRPAVSSYGPASKVCGSCHDPHGSDRAPGGAPYARLLRSWADTTTAVFEREAFCAACHAARPASRFDGTAVYLATGHYTGLPDPASGTKIRCSICHTPHGSSIAPLLVSAVGTPAAPAAATIVANDRRLCLACHPQPLHTWSGETTYAATAHALSTATVPVVGEWAAVGAVRRVGECQVCHAAMGRSDGAGGAIPKLTEKAGRQLCDTCHKAAPAAAATNLASLAYPASEATAVELAVVWGPAPESAARGRADLYTRALTGASPRPLIGPRGYAAPDAGGVAAAGDVDGDGQTELVVADRGAKTLRIRHRDALLGLSEPDAITIVPTPDLIAIGRFIAPLADLVGLPQIAVVDASTGQVSFYANILGNTLTQVGGPLAVGTAPSGIAAGDLGGTALTDLVVTSAGSHDVRLFTQDPSSVTTFLPATTFSTGVGSAPRGPSIGDVNTDQAGNEIVVCLSGSSSVGVFDRAGVALGAAEVLAGGAGTAVPWASAVADVVPAVAPSGRNGLEIAVAMRSVTGASRLAVVPEASAPATGLAGGAAILYYDTPALTAAGSLLCADIEDDGVAETVLGGGGAWAGALGMNGPSVRVYRPSGAALLLAQTLVGGGTELAGTAPALAAADFGAVLPSRHPIDEVPVAHVSTETAPFARHVTCADCHNSHEASATLVTTAPSITGSMRGAWGTAVTNTAPAAQTISAAARASNQYEVCLKCHAESTGGRENIASLVNTQNVSVHAVEGTASPRALAGSYVGPWGNDSVLYCSSCHGNSAGAGEASGGHRSGAAPILARPYLGVTPSDASGLCFGCHLASTYYDGAAPGGTDGAVNTSSRFFDSTQVSPAPATGIAVNGALHKLHSRMFDTGVPASGGLGLGCQTCHVSHGSSTNAHLIRSDVGWVHPLPETDRGQCTNLCHGGVPKAYIYNGP